MAFSCGRCRSLTRISWSPIDTLEFPPGVAPTNVAAANQLGSSYPNFFDWHRQSLTFESLASYDVIDRLFSKVNGEGARVLEGGRVSANLFSLLGVAPALGRAFTADEQLPGHRVAILSHELWVSDFASSPNVLGQTVKISDEPVHHRWSHARDLPLSHRPALLLLVDLRDRRGRSVLRSLLSATTIRLSIVGRLKRGVGIKQALAELNSIQLGLARQYSEDRYRLGRLDQPIVGRSSLRYPSRALAFVLCGWSRPAHRLRQRGRTPPRPRQRTPSRSGSAHSSRCEPHSRCASIADRSVAPRLGGRRCRHSRLVRTIASWTSPHPQ